MRIAKEGFLLGGTQGGRERLPYLPVLPAYFDILIGACKFQVEST
jgi:hypothetical protein